MSISETLLLFQLITTIVFGILGYIKKKPLPLNKKAAFFST